MTRRLPIALAAVGVTVLLAGCLRPVVTTEPEPGPTASADAAPAGPAGPGRAHTGSTTRVSLEGRFSYQTMPGYLDAVVPMVTQWLAETYRGRLPAPRVVFVPHGARGPERCQGGSGYSAASYEYCGVDQLVYLGQDTLWTFYDQTGDAGPAVGIAHEFGHHVQQLLGVPSPATAAQSIRHENQADCIAGAWVRYTDEQGWLEPDDDLKDVDALFPLIGSAEGPDRDHGTTAERRAAFEAGLDGDLVACDAFYPATPVDPARALA